MDVLSLLRSKNRCVKRFIKLSSAFLGEFESVPRADASARLKALENLQDKREQILKAIDLYDRKISEKVSLMDPADKSPELIRLVKELVAEQETLLIEVFQVDEKLLKAVETEKTGILLEIQRSQKNKNDLQKFKSAWINASGEELDRKL